MTSHFSTSFRSFFDRKVSFASLIEKRQHYEVMSSWFGSSSQAEKNADDIELDNRGENSLIDEQEEEMAQAEKLLPDMTDEEIEAMKVEKAKKARRQQV